MEEDVSKWTEILERALDMPLVDWLIRSETSPDEAFDIEVTGGWVTFLSPFSRTVIHESCRSAVPQLRYLILLVFPSWMTLSRSHLPTRMSSFLQKRRQALYHCLAQRQPSALPARNPSIYPKMLPLSVSPSNFLLWRHKVSRRSVRPLLRTRTFRLLAFLLSRDVFRQLMTRAFRLLTFLLPLEVLLPRLRRIFLLLIHLVLLLNYSYHLRKVSQLPQVAHPLLRGPFPWPRKVHALRTRQFILKSRSPVLSPMLLHYLPIVL
jgi:hypothetical protein